MSHSPLLSHPKVALLPVLGRDYKELTDDLLQQWFYDLYRDYQFDPEYLFVSPKGRHDIRRAMESLLSHRFFGMTGQTVDDLTSHYPNRLTGTMLHVVVLPTLPDHTLLVGDPEGLVFPHSVVRRVNFPAIL